MRVIDFDYVLSVEGRAGAGQDRAAVFEGPLGPVVVLADGAGGCSGGAVAAEVVIDRVGLRSKVIRSPEDCLDLLSAVDVDLFARVHAGLSTAVVVSVLGRRVVGASVGDSQAWLMSEEGPLELTQAQHRKPLLGSGQACPVPFFTDISDETLVVASDGLWNYVPFEAIFTGLRAEVLVGAAERLAALPRLRSGARPDDLALVLLRRRGGGLRAPTERTPSKAPSC